MRNYIAAAILILLAVWVLSTAEARNSVSTGCLPNSVKAKLADVERKFGKITVISAHRSGATIAVSGSPSLHASCRAVDFKVSGNQPAAARWLNANHSGGVGTYSGGFRHIHIDNGPRVRFHHCFSNNLRRVKC